MGEGRAPFQPRFCGLIGLDLKSFPEPCRAYRRDKGTLFLCVQFLRCSKMALQSHFEGFSAGFKCSNVEKKSGGRKKKSDALPPPLIICGAGVARAAATGAYKDLCARKGVRLQPRNEWGRSALAPGAQTPASAICSCRWVGSSCGPRDPAWQLSRAGHSPPPGWEGLQKAGKLGALSSLLASPHPGPTRTAIPPRKRPN